ncbi:C40 family peptidase [Lentilactobacillus hilgardii]|uniref:C40 family peptidase n=1 Tax=Lentilactobacillus hilgardii TaxID=1588 RepID=UPI00019C6039|nr:NlpC/P60 family protein [Lentilactobacillus hilgardii]EEI18292.1 NlpC/P60 family protein [Lentilactobacillus buchneri ATCC 11577]MCT3396638.1 hydrolase [Lentilactobacillus hilgardii]MCT3400503.1 hydrolase [Lentilactobacillus hilgardii]
MHLHKKFALVLFSFLFLLATSLFTSFQTQAASFNSVYKVAKQKLGSPYVYGATGPTAFDCSGFTTYVYKRGAKLNLPRTAQAQYSTYKKVAYRNIQKGDLVFFGYSSLSVTHVGMYIGNGKMIDSQNYGVITEKVKAPWWNYVGAARVTHLS